MKKRISQQKAMRKMRKDIYIDEKNMYRNSS